MSNTLESDNKMLSSIKNELFSAVIGDVMDKMDLRNQFLPPQIQPLRDDMVLVGRAMTVLVQNIHDSADTQDPKQAYGLLFEALDNLKPNEVYICTGAAPDYALWGELMSTRAMKLGAVGAVVDGYSRDTPGILDLDFPTFSYGRYAQDQAYRGSVVDYRVPIEVKGVSIKPGDLIFGDLDGVCVIPREKENEIIAEAFGKVRGEKLVQTALKEGMSASEAFETFGIM
jgi:regulator of RNase E activity RraA